jgi:hypothetical protein
MEWDASRRAFLGMDEWRGAEIIILEIERASVGSRNLNYTCDVVLIAAREILGVLSATVGAVEEV